MSNQGCGPLTFSLPAHWYSHPILTFYSVLRLHRFWDSTNLPGCQDLTPDVFHLGLQDQLYLPCHPWFISEFDYVCFLLYILQCLCDVMFVQSVLFSRFSWWVMIYGVDLLVEFVLWLPLLSQSTLVRINCFTQRTDIQIHTSGLSASTEMS